MANENTQDLAVLGFRVETKNAEDALGRIESKIRGLDSAINITDKLLAEKVQKALTPFNDVRDTIAEIVTSESKLSKAVGSIKDLAETVQGMNNLGEVAKNMKAAFTELDTKYVTKLTQKFINMSKAFNGTAMTLDVAVKVTNPEELDALSKKLLIGIDPVAETQINALNSTLTSIKNGLSINIKIPDKSELETWAANVDKVVQPEIKFDQKANTIVQNLYTAIRGKIAEKGSILVPLQFTFGKPKLDMPDTQITDAVKRGRDALRDTLLENVKDFGGNAQFEKLWEKAILGGPKSIEKIRTILATRTSWLEEDIEESMRAAALNPNKYGELLEQGMGSIPVEVANTMDKITSQAQHLLEPLQNKLIVRPEVGVAKQSDTEIQKIFNDFSAHVGELASKSLKKVIATAEKVIIQPKSAVVDTAYLQAAVGIVTATKTVTASADVILDPFSIKVKTDNLGPESIKLTRKGLKVDTITFEPDKINFRGLDKIANVLANPVGVNADLKVKPNTVSIDEEALNKLLPLKYAVKPIDVKAKIKVASTAATVDSEAAKQIVGTSKTAIKVQAKINLDPLPGDEIEKMGLLVTQINNVDIAYGQLLGTVRTLRDTVRETESSMSKELRGLIKGEQHKAEAKIKDPEKAAAADAEKIKKQAEAEQAALDALAKAQAELQELHKRYQFNPEENSQNRQKGAKEALDLSKKLEDEAGKVATNRDDRQQSYLKVEAQFKATLSQKNETVQELTKNLKAEATAMRDKAKVDAAAILNTAKAEAAMRGFSASVTTAGIEIVKLGRIIPTNLTDPFKQAKAELGETGSRLADFGRMFGLYFSGRTVINYFRQAAESANAFGMEIRRIQSLATDFDFTNLRNELMDIDARFGNVIHNANALYWAYSSGVRGTEKELANFVEIMSKTSTTIKSDIMPTVDAATSIMNAWNLSAGSAAEIGDLLFSIIKYGKSNAQQLTTSLGHVVAPAAALNVNLDELGATIATLTKTMKTNRALTYLSNILGKMASPTKQVQEAAAEMGIELSATAIKARGFAQTLADIRRVTGGDIGKIAKLFPDLRGQRAAITLLSTQYKDFEQQLENMRGKAGAMEEALGKITDTPEAQLKAIRNTISMISIGAGDAVNTTITFGGLLGPILEKINKLEHGGRELLGHLTASAGATVGLAVASRALAAAQYGAAQAAYQMAAAANETHKVELSNALLAEKRLIDEKGLAVAALKRELSEKHNNDEILRSLREQAIAMKDASNEARQRLTDAKQTLNIEDQMLKRRMEDRAVDVGTSRTRLASLGSWLNDLQTGDAQKKLLADINLVKRLQADISISQATLSDEEAQLVGKYRNIIQPLVEQETEARKRMMEAMESGDVESFENQKSFLNYILSQIKTNTGISGQMAQYDTQGRLLEQETRRVMLAEMQKGLVAGQNYEHSLLIQFVEDEIKTEKTKLATLQSDLDVLKQNHATNDEIRTQLDAITKQTAVVNELDAKRLEIQTQIEQRERSLTGRGREQLQILSDIQKEAQQKLQIDMEDVENLQKNLDIEMRRASFIGGATLEATKASVAARMQEHNVVLQLNTLERERETLVDKEGKLINESAAAAERVAAIDKERVALQEKLVSLQQRYMELGIKAGSERARNMRIAGWNGELDELVNSLARDKGVVKEAVKAMSSEIGKGIFGGKLGGRGMQGLSMLAPFIPGLGKWGMGISMLTSFDVFGKAASGMTRLTSEVYRLLGTTEQLQKKGLFPMEKGVEDLTKNVMLSTVSIKGMVASLTGLKALGWAGGSKAFLAALTGPTGIASIVGVSLIGAIAGTLGYAFSQTEKGGPLGDVMEKLFGIEDLKRYSDLLDARRERMQTERETHESMVRETQRMLKIQEEQNSTIKKSLVWQRETNALRQALVDLSVYDEIQMKELELFNKRTKRQRMQEQRKGVLGAMQSSPFAALELNKLDAEMPSKAEIDELANATKELYRKYWAGVGETAYQQLRESLEADRDAAFTPMMDANGKMDLANKMATMAEKRLSSLLGYDDETLDLTMKSSLQIREMIRKRIAELKKSAEDAHIALEDAKEQANMYAEGSPERTKADETVKQLELAYEAAAKKIDADTTNINSAFRDYYNNIANKANAFIEQLKENSGNQQKMAKFNALFTQNDESFNVLGDTIVDYWDAMNKLRTDYANKAGVFKGMDADAAQIAFKDALKKLGDQQIQNITTNINNIKQMQDNLTRFIETQANDMRQLSKQQFEYNMSNPALAGKRSQLIKNRMKELDSIMQPIIQQRDAAFMKAQELMNQPGQMARAQESLEEAYKYENQVKGLAMEELELVKKRADIERGINASMYQLASTLQGKFESTAQTAVDAYSVESIRLQMRQIGENIAPPIQTNAQEIERKLTAQLFQRSIDNYNLLQQASLRLQQQISSQAQNADKMGNAAVIIQKASDTAQVAAETFKRTVESNRTTFRVKRI